MAKKPKPKRKYREPRKTGLNITPKEDYAEYQRQYFKKIRQPRAWREGEHRPWKDFVKEKREKAKRKRKEAEK